MKEYRFDISSREAGSRVDSFLTKALGCSRSRVKGLLDGGKVLVNRRRVVIAGWELEPGDHVLVRVPDSVPVTDVREHRPSDRRVAQRKAPGRVHAIRVDKVRHSALRNIGKPTLSYEHERSLGSAEAPTRSGRRRRSRRRSKKADAADSGARTSKSFLTVYHHDKHLLVVEKPAGLLTVAQRGSDHPHLVGHVQSYLRRKHRGSRHSFLRPLHRLDAETSGIVVMATSREGNKLSAQFKQHRIDRRYLAVVHGAVEQEQTTVDRPLEKGSFGGGRKARVAKEGAGRAAKTNVRVIERYANATLVEAAVVTGRTHQIRVHLAWAGHPVVGDKLYHDERAAIPFKRHALHAHTLGFRHPVDGKKMSFTSPLPDDLQQLIDKLRTG